MKKKICIISSSRADYGLLYCLMKELQNNPSFVLQVIATGMHLSPEYGYTYKSFEKDGFKINKKIEILLSSDTSIGVCKAMGLALISFSEALAELQPDLVLVLGDRFEILSAVQAAVIMKIPTAHIAGGDVTVGAYDDSIRHSITKMSHLHFVTNDEAFQRVVQMGENPCNVFNVGSPGIDYINRLELIKREIIEKKIDFKFRSKNLLITYHPTTLDFMPVSLQIKELLMFLDKLDEDTGIILTMPNCDNESKLIKQMITDFVKNKKNAIAVTSLGQDLYLNTMAQIDVVLGNSSSGLYEAPSLKKPTVNIGKRQEGRIIASSIINCKPDAKSIKKAYEKALMLDCSNTINPYGNGNSSKKIIGVLQSISDYKTLIQKRFFEMKTGDGKC